MGGGISRWVSSRHPTIVSAILRRNRREMSASKVATPAPQPISVPMSSGHATVPPRIVPHSGRLLGGRSIHLPRRRSTSLPRPIMPLKLILAVQIPPSLAAGEAHISGSGSSCVQPTNVTPTLPSPIGIPGKISKPEKKNSRARALLPQPRARRRHVNEWMGLMLGGYRRR